MRDAVRYALVGLLAGACALGGAFLGDARHAWIAGLAGAALGPLALLLLAQTLRARLAAFTGAVVLGALLLPVALVARPASLLALAFLAAGLLATRLGEETPLLPYGGPTLAALAMAADPAVGLVAFVALLFLHGAVLPTRARLTRATLPQAATLLVCGAVLLLLPATMLPLSRPLRLAILLAAIVANLLVAHAATRFTLGSGARRVATALLALLPLLAAIALVAIGGRLPAIQSAGLLGTLGLVAAAAVTLALVGGVLLGLLVLLATAHDAKPWLVALLVTLPLGLLVGLSAGLALLLPVAASVGVLAARGARHLGRRSRADASSDAG